MASLRIRRGVGRLLLAVMLFAQAAYALAGCEINYRGAAAALAEAGQTCHQPETSANLCLSHCLAGDQTVDKTPVSVPAMIDAPVLFVTQLAPLWRTANCTIQPVDPGCGPPPRILFQSLLI
jgi:hypothetical protein